MSGRSKSCGKTSQFHRPRKSDESVSGLGQATLGPFIVDVAVRVRQCLRPSEGSFLLGSLPVLQAREKSQGKQWHEMHLTDFSFRGGRVGIDPSEGDNFHPPTMTLETLLMCQEVSVAEEHSASSSEPSLFAIDPMARGLGLLCL